MVDSRAKGARGERDVVDYLNANGYPHAERRLSGAADDRGDIIGIPGVTIEVKARRAFEPAAWVDQLAEEMDNTPGEGTGFVIAKRRQRGDVADWYAITPVGLMLPLLKGAGW
ncbi:MAG: hypothetical protein GY925_23715 [Actinomycetia bacterium]|nr:hypothetical protein [Actinomycetes bacterium]